MHKNEPPDLNQVTYFKYVYIFSCFLERKGVGLSFGLILSSACIYYYFSTNISLYFIIEIY